MIQNKLSAKWSDLLPRVLSAIVMAAIAVVDIAMGNPYYLIMIAVVIGLCVGEFARLLQPDDQSTYVALGVLAAASVVFGTYGFDGGDFLRDFISYRTLELFIPPIIGTILIKQHKALFFGYCLLIMLAGYGFMALGPSVLLIWFILIIIVSDVAGYFVGRIVGGPKFWPRVSPKKTWSGTVAGWVGALLVGLVAAYQGVFTPTEALFAPLIAFAGQMGDIIESAIKRKIGVKDSSHLIPGHGGVLDRFDAMIGAAGALMILSGISALFFVAG